jgi:dTDP-4-amino-4,6-dideoxygalactose transaminase
MSQLALYGGTPVRTRPFPPWPQGGAEELAYLQQVIKGTRWFAGPRGDDPESLGTLFGERFAGLHGARFGLPVANGSVAIEIGLRALGIGAGDEVIVPSYTFVSTATSVLMVGALPVFADIDPENYCLDPGDAAGRIGPHTRAILPVHLGGQMADMEGLLDLTRRHDLSLLEDCAQAIDASRLGKKAGTWGDLGTFSFQSNKTITAGEGGLVLTDDPNLAEKTVALRAFGRLRPQGPLSGRSSAFTSHILSGNYRLSELQSAVLLAQMEKFPGQDHRRQINAERLTRALAGLPGIRPVRSKGADSKHGYYYYLIHYDPEAFGDMEPDRLATLLNAEGIPFHPGDRDPIYRHPVFKPENLAGWLCPEALESYRKAFNWEKLHLPAAEAACRSTLILRHPVLLSEPGELDDVVEALWKVQKNIEEAKAIER